MKNLSLFAFTSMLLLGCAHGNSTATGPSTKSSDSIDATTPAAKVESALIETAKKDCKADTVCTREYLPTTCKFMGKDFASSNPCEAKKLARAYACDSGEAYADNKVACKSEKAAKR
jgi:hypothetical protein